MKQRGEHEKSVRAVGKMMLKKKIEAVLGELNEYLSTGFIVDYKFKMLLGHKLPEPALPTVRITCSEHVNLDLVLDGFSEGPPEIMMVCKRVVLA